MALIDCKFYSETLKVATAITVILPERLLKNCSADPCFGENTKTLYLLHGLTDDHTIWLRRTSIERYATDHGIAVVMPDGARSFYADMEFGGAYESFIAKEVPRVVRSLFSLSARREDNFIAGLSMGGYGAFKFALNYPENYCAAASLSGVTDLCDLVEKDSLKIHQDLVSIYGEDKKVRDTRNDLFYVSHLLKQRDDIECPRLYQCCGEDDVLYAGNIKFRDFALAENLPLTWESDPGYGHSWAYWDFRIQSALQWMLGKPK
ncbi:MAG: esterase family protein [Lentisphaerae bacterium]|jgi:S-formylglutathione hydrolase FrmB|nr:esterase family protein [Lentisphaerota bacterium]